MNQEDKKLFFAEIADGGFARDVQAEFERVQRVAEERGDVATLVVKVAVTPPNRGESFGNITYEVEAKLPKRKSGILQAEFDNGSIVADGRTIGDILQEELNLEIPRGPLMHVADKQ